MPTPTPAQLVDAHSAARQRLTDSATLYAATQAERFTGWYDTAEITAFSERVAKRVQASQRRTAAVTDSFLLRVLRLLLGREVRSGGTIDVSKGLRSGVTPAGAYGRVADTYRYRSALGDSPEKALEAAVRRARVAADTDVTLAFQRQVQATLGAVAERQQLVPVPRTSPDAGGEGGEPQDPLPAEAGPVLGYRRIIHPELSKYGVSCGLCIAAATRLYSYEDLLPVHSDCHCSVMVAIEGKDPGLELTAKDLGQIYKDAGNTTAGRALKKVRYAVSEHGELGPRLTWDGQSFRDAADVARDEDSATAAA